MDYFRDNLSMTSTGEKYVSIYCLFVDTLCRHVHDVDMNEQFANLKSQIVTSSWGGIRRAAAIASLIRVCALNAKRDKLWPVAMRH